MTSKFIFPKNYFVYWMKYLKRSEDPRPEVGAWAPSEGSLILMSKLLGIFVNVVLDMIGNFNLT